jgi:hypothetical protein
MFVFRKYKIALTKINYKKFKIYTAYTEHARTGIIIVMVATFWIEYMILPKRSTTSVTSGTGTVYTSEAHEFTPGF